MTTRRGFTLVELLMAMLLTAILGIVVCRMLLATSKFFGRDSAGRDARTVSAGALNLLRTELRGADPTFAILQADSGRLVVRAPFAMGILCNRGALSATVSLLPADSQQVAGAGFSGYAWRDSSGAFQLVEGTMTRSAGSASLCTAAGITTLATGSVVSLGPLPPASAAAGTPVVLYQRVTYRFAPSTALPGRVALWRDVAATGVSEELAAPFDASARFRFFAGTADTSQAVAPAALSQLHGIQLVFNGASERTPRGRATPVVSALTTAVFFRNGVL